MKTDEKSKNSAGAAGTRGTRSHKNNVDRLIAERCNAASSMRQGLKKQIADRLGVSQSTVSGYLNGDTKVPVAMVVVISEITGVTLDWLLTGKGPGPAIDRTALSPTEQVLTKPAGSRPMNSSTALPWNNETAGHAAESPSAPAADQRRERQIRDNFVIASLPLLTDDQSEMIFDQVRGMVGK